MLLSPKGTKGLLSHAKLKTALSRDWAACVLVWVWSFVCTRFPLSHSWVILAHRAGTLLLNSCRRLRTGAHTRKIISPPSAVGDVSSQPQCLSLCILATSLKFRDWIGVEGPHQRTVEFESGESHLALRRAQGPCTRGVCCPTHELSWAAAVAENQALGF